MTLGDAIKKRRDEMGLTQQQLGVLVGVAGMTIYRWENAGYLPPRRYWPALEQALHRKIHGATMIDTSKKEMA